MSMLEDILGVVVKILKDDPQGWMKLPVNLVVLTVFSSLFALISFFIIRKKKIIGWIFPLLVWFVLANLSVLTFIAQLASTGHPLNLGPLEQLPLGTSPYAYGLILTYLLLAIFLVISFVYKRATIQKGRH